MTKDISKIDLPILIQGGMGVSISSWKLARKVARRGHMGVVSGTAIERVMALRLQEGDEDGQIRRAFDAFPNRELANRIYKRWHNPDGLAEPGQYKGLTMYGVNPPQHFLELTVIAAFTEVWLAKEEKAGPIGINLLEKIQAPTLPVLYGALLAGVDYVLMGAGIPREIPGHMDQLCQHQSCSLRLNVDDGSTESIPFDPNVIGLNLPPLARPQFLAIISSHVLAMALARSGGVDGFIVEGHMAGGHNAPPRGWSSDSNDEPVYGPRDNPDLERVRKLGKPFWLGGAQNHSEALKEAQAAGAVGIQVGTAFAFCSDSGMDNNLRKRALSAALNGTTRTITEARGSPTGFPFKTLDLEDTEGGRPAEERKRQVCIHGCLRSAYRKEDGSIGWRCASELESTFLTKGGEEGELTDRRCVCNGLLATAGHPHAMKEGGVELPLITSGAYLDFERFLNEKDDYDADAVIDLLGIPYGPMAVA
ncbi:MAG: nitronate monooxygenase [Opitutales bacterium]|nr:nitronate monooxygenase [Opitutales bacterium]